MNTHLPAPTTTLLNSHSFLLDSASPPIFSLEQLITSRQEARERRNLFALSEKEIDQFLRQIMEATRKQRINTIAIIQLDNLVGTLSVGGDALASHHLFEESFKAFSGR